MVPDIFADVFVARDGDATTAGLEILAAVVAAVLIAGIVIGVACWRGRRERKREWTARRDEWTAWREEADARLAALAGRDEYQDKALAEIIGPPPRDRQLHAVN